MRGYFLPTLSVGSPTQFVWQLPINIRSLTTGENFFNKILRNKFVWYG